MDDTYGKIFPFFLFSGTLFLYTFFLKKEPVLRKKRIEVLKEKQVLRRKEAKDENR